MKSETRNRLVQKHPAVFGKAVLDCGDGWAGLLDELAVRLQGTGVRVSHVKEKYALLQVTTCNSPESDARTVRDVWKAVDEIERRSGAVCEECGAPGELRDEEYGERFSWNKTLCDACVLAGDVLEA